MCKDTDDDSWVLIENQLATTDHTHLGQLLTYASGLSAVTIIWIAARFTDEHRASLDWLNDITDESFRFIGLEVELWRIDESLAAPKFNIVAKPNDWTRSISRAAKRISEDNLSETNIKQKEFWQLLVNINKENQFHFRMAGPLPRNSIVVHLGKSGIEFKLSINTKKKRVGVAVNLFNHNASAYFNLLARERSEVELELGSKLEWLGNPNQRSSQIVLFLDNVEPLAESKWPELQQWCFDKLLLFEKVFAERLRALDAADWKIDEEQP